MDYPQSRHTVTGWADTGRPAHADRPRPVPTRVLVAAAAGAAVVLAAVGLGAAACLNSLEPARSSPTSASHITVTPGSDTVPATP